MRILFAILLWVCASGAFADDEGTAEPGNKVVAGELRQAAKAAQGQPLKFVVKRYAGVAAEEAAYERIEAALQAVANEQGLKTSDQAAVTVEVDSSFYVYTNRFNARLVRLQEYTQAQLHGATSDDAVRAKQAPDMVRIAAGVLGIVMGWVSPSFGSYMVAGGATPALFGSGKAQHRLFVAGKERYERGEQEVYTKVRVMRGGDTVATFSVRNWTSGDEPPFQIESLVAVNWSTVAAVLSGRNAELLGNGSPE